jgi:hypothetical protein
VKHTTKGDNAGTAVLIPVQAIAGTTPVVVAELMGQFDGVGLVLVTTGTVAGNWKIEAANDYQPTNAQGLQNTSANPGNWGDVTAVASPAIVQPAGAPKSQAVQIAPFSWGAMRLTFTPTSGAGNVAAYRFAKGNS